MKRLLHKLIAVLMFAGLAGFLPALAASPAQAIVGGTPVTNNDLAFMAQIDDNARGTTCSGTLIDPSWVLTAAHCAIHAASAGDMSVRVGNTQRNVGGQFRQVSRIIVNPGYPLTTPDQVTTHDEALLQLATPVTNITPIKLGMPADSYLWDGVGPGGLLGANDSGLAAGWGRTSSTSAVSAQLLSVGVNILTPVADSTGARLLRADHGDCQGDSGSPLIVYSGGRMIEAGVLSGVITGCTSTAFYNEVGAGVDRTWVMSHVTNRLYTSFGTADWNGDGYQDVIARQDSTGQLWLYPGAGPKMSTASRVLLSYGFQGFTPFGVADWNKDGRPDVIARDDATGALWLYLGPQDVNALITTRTKISASSFSDYTPFGVADWNGDGNQDILARDRTGNLYLGRGLGTKDALVFLNDWLGGGWNKYTPFGVADYDHVNESGYHPDIVARDNDTGDLWDYPGDGRLGPSTIGRVQIGYGWKGFTPFGLASWDTDGMTDILARDDSTGYLWMYAGQGRRVSTLWRAQIGYGW